MNLRPFTACLNLVGQCTTCLSPTSALPIREATARLIAARQTRCFTRMWTPPRQTISNVWRDRRLSFAKGAGPKIEEDAGNTRAASVKIRVTSPEEMEETGAFFGTDSGPGDVVLLSGDLGAGKTCFARGFVRARLGDAGLAVTSPSYLLDNTYEVEEEGFTLHHMDLYRLKGGSDLRLLDIPAVLKTSVCLIEWPDRLGPAQPANRLDVNLRSISEEERVLTLTGHGSWWAGMVNDFQDERPTRIT